jgi:sugar/nucleoside kinase (ribokinase family)
MLPALRQYELAALLERAHARGATIILDVAVPSGAAPGLEELSGLLPLADYFVPNVDEARSLTGASDPRLQAERLRTYGARHVLIKLGEQGVYVRSADRDFELEAPTIDVIEPSGAGDAFAAGLIVGTLERWDIERTVRFANVIGASACTALGAWGGVFTREAAEVALAQHPLEMRTRTASGHASA